MAAGVPLVTTRVGQAPELVADGENGCLPTSTTSKRSRRAVQRVHDDAALAARLRTAGRPTAEAHADERLDPLWADLLDGFVERTAACALMRARAGRYARAAVALGCGYSRRAAATRRARLLRARSCAGGGRAGRRRIGEVSDGSRPASRTIRVDFTLLYLGSTWLPRDLGPLLWPREAPLPSRSSSTRTASRYPGWAGDRTEELNDRYGARSQAADHVLYQSEFCKRLGRRLPRRAAR